MKKVMDVEIYLDFRDVVYCMMLCLDEKKKMTIR